MSVARSPPLPSISVVIPTRNRPAGLRACLEALAAQSAPDFEVMVVDDASDQPARQVVSEFDGRLELHLLVNQHRCGPAHARNRAVAAASGDYIAFVDDDVRVVPTWLQEHMNAQQATSGMVGTIGPLAAPPDWRAQAWTRWEADTLQREYDRMRRGDYRPTWRQFHTGNALVSRSAIVDAGGFDEQFLRAEDIELGLRMSWRGVQFAFAPRAIGWHYSARALDAWLAVARSYGQFDRQLDQMHPEMNWLRVVRRERARRHPVVRMLRIANANEHLRRWAVQASARAGDVAYRAGFRRVAQAALSSAYDLEYARGLKESVPPTVRGGTTATGSPGRLGHT